MLHLYNKPLAKLHVIKFKFKFTLLTLLTTKEGKKKIFLVPGSDPTGFVIPIVEKGRNRGAKLKFI